MKIIEASCRLLLRLLSLFNVSTALQGRMPVWSPFPDEKRGIWKAEETCSGSHKSGFLSLQTCLDSRRAVLHLGGLESQEWNCNR